MLSICNVMSGKVLNLDALPMKDGLSFYVKLLKDHRIICRTLCINPPVQFPALWNISDLKPTAKYQLTGLPRFFLYPAFEDDIQRREWDAFTCFLQKHNRVAVVLLEAFECYILPPDMGTNFTEAVVLYRACKTDGTPDDHKQVSDEVQMKHIRHLTPKHEEIGDSLDSSASVRDTSKHRAKCSSRKPHLEPVVNPHAGSIEGVLMNQDKFVKKTFVRTDPSYLKTLGQTHSGWVFGAVAELVDNSRDANATKLEISVETHYSKKDGKNIPMLSVIDDGHGMSHQDIMVMLSFGHKQPDADNQDLIGRFGIGFKTGAMKLGRDVIVLSQTTESRSIAFLSQSLNEGKDNLEIPIVSYRRQGSFMEVDRSIQSEVSADYHLKAIKEFSTFNEYFIGEKLGLFGANGKGTQIYIWNLDKWGSDYCLEWQNCEGGKGSSNEDDILIRSRRIRSRPGQVSREVPLDYSLRSFLEVIFLDPRMKIYVQGSLVKSRPLAKSLNKTVILNDTIMGKPVQLTLGRCQLEWERANCGIFLYWHGRLIEAYKRVGGMVHNADMGRGVIGVIDVTDLMTNGNDVLVHNTKQAFLDCEAYGKLEDWLGQKSDEYWDEHFDSLHMKKGNARCKPDHEWVQCDKCRKWRILSSRFDSKTLPKEWFCYMRPFSGKCETPEEKMEPGVVTVGAKRSTSDGKKKLVIPAQKVNSEHELDIDGSGESSQTVEDDVPSPALKNLKRVSSARSCKKERK